MNNNYLSKSDLINKVNEMQEANNKMNDRLRVVEHQLSKVQYLLTQMHIEDKIKETKEKLVEIQIENKERQVKLR